MTTADLEESQALCMSEQDDSELEQVVVGLGSSTSNYDHSNKKIGLRMKDRIPARFGNKRNESNDSHDSEQKSEASESVNLIKSSRSYAQTAQQKFSQFTAQLQPQSRKRLVEEKETAESAKSPSPSKQDCTVVCNSQNLQAPSIIFTHSPSESSHLVSSPSHVPVSIMPSSGPGSHKSSQSERVAVSWQVDPQKLGKDKPLGRLFKKKDVGVSSHTPQHSFLTEVTDVKTMEKGLLQLLDDFHLGKLQAFGKNCTMEQMEAIREQQERLSRLHFDLGSQKDMNPPLSDDGLKSAASNLKQLMSNLEELSVSIEGLHSGTDDILNKK